MSSCQTIAGRRTCHSVFVGVIAFVSTGWWQPAIAGKKAASGKTLPQGAIVYVAPLESLDPEFGDTLTIFSLSTPSLVRKILRMPQPGDVSVSSVSADGKKIAFYWTSPENSYSHSHEYLRVLDISKGTETTVFHGHPATTSWSPDGSILWVGPLTNDGESLFLDVENRRMWRWKPTPSAASERHGEAWLSLDDALFTAQGILGTQSVAVAVPGCEGCVFQRKKSFVLFHWQQPTHVLNGDVEHELRQYAIAPDLSMIADVDTMATLAVRPLGGEKAKSIALPVQFPKNPKWSPDSQWVAMQATSKETSKLVAVNVASGRTLTLAKVEPAQPGAIWVASKPVAKSTAAAEIAAGLGPGESLLLPMDCWREGLGYSGDWPRYKPVGPCPWPLRKAPPRNSDE